MTGKPVPAGVENIDARYREGTIKISRKVAERRLFQDM